MPHADLLLHPVRLRIVQTFLGGRTLTTKELATEINDVPPASLYRQVARLERGGALTVVRERKVRGTLERTYALRSSALGVSLDELAVMSPDDHRQLFMSFVAGLIGDFERYLDRDEVDFAVDGVGYRSEALWLDDQEFSSVVRDLDAVLAPHRISTPGSDRSRRTFSLFTLPSVEPT
jgi:DNA-binding transcriptional ArsR family regulator